MRIALVSSLYAPYQCGGAERSTQLLAEGLSQRGHAVCVITLAEPGLAGCSVINGVSVQRVALENWYWPYSGSPGNAAARAAWHLRDFRNAAMSARLGSLLDRERPDILNTQSLGGFSVGIWRQARERGVPIVHTLRDYYLMCPPGAMYRKAANCGRICARCLPFAVYRRHASQAVQAVIGISRFILDRHLRAGFFTGSRTAQVIFNPLAVVPGRSPKNPKGRLVYGFIGRLCPEKGIHWLLDTFIASAHPGDRLVVAGKGEPAFVESLKAQYASPSVTFIGHVDPALFHEQVDVVVVPSLWNEPFGRSAMEPLSYGIPVIASNRGGLAEIVEDGVTGIIVDPDDTGSLARAIGRFSAEPELVGRLGGNCGRRLSQFSQESIAAAYESLFAEVLSPPGSRCAPPAGARGTAFVRAR
jgi:glycosyltransferase involved in cell wall biosynthesis